jgi:hypothetical protein
LPPHPSNLPGATGGSLVPRPGRSESESPQRGLPCSIPAGADAGASPGSGPHVPDSATTITGSQSHGTQFTHWQLPACGSS